MGAVLYLQATHMELASLHHGQLANSCIVCVKTSIQATYN